MLNNIALWKKLNTHGEMILIAGPCVVESEELCLEVAGKMRRICSDIGIFYIFKASYDKANRTSTASFRGLGMEEGLHVLAKVRSEIGVPVLTDIHNPAQAGPASEVADILQIPSLLCRQTDLITAAAGTGKIVNIKKGQFMSPKEMLNAVNKTKVPGGGKALLTERGTFFGYNNLVSDMRAIPIMQGFRVPVIFDATHSIQMPGAGGDKSSGQREFAPVLARAAIAAGADGLFIETHPDPPNALSDGPNMIPLKEMSHVLKGIQKIWKAVH
jgi:2-dehydro-3-deoxyphosphooctonate aldolase (KDO 8-P synthase)